jgi:hypothetical protein
MKFSAKNLRLRKAAARCALGNNEINNLSILNRQQK